MCGGGGAIPIATPVNEHEILKPRASFINFQIFFIRVRGVYETVKPHQMMAVFSQDTVTFGPVAHLFPAEALVLFSRYRPQ